MGGVTQEHKKICNISETVQDRTKVIMTHTRFRLVPKSTTLDDLERRIQGLPKVIKYPLLSQEWIKLRTSNLAGAFKGPSEQKPIKIWEKRERARIQGLPKFFKYPLPGTGKATNFKFCRPTHIHDSYDRSEQEPIKKS